MDLDYDSSDPAVSSSDGDDPQRRQQNRRKSRAKNREQAWLGSDSDDDGDARRGDGQSRQGRRQQGGSSAATAQHYRDTEATFVRSEAAEKPEEPAPAAAPPAAAPAAAGEPDGLPPKTQERATIHMASPKKDATPAPRRVSATEEKESLGFLANASKTKSSKLMNMMKKAGWKPGFGMGKHEQGISEAIAVKVRPKGVGVGSIDEKTEQQRRKERKEQGIPEPSDAPKSLVEDLPPSEDEAPLRNLRLEKKQAARDAWKKKKTQQQALLSEVSHLTASAREGKPLKIVDLSKEAAAEEGEIQITHDARGEHLHDVRVGVTKALHDIEAGLRIVDTQISAEKSRLASLEAEASQIDERVKTQSESIEQVVVLSGFFEKLTLKLQESLASGDDKRCDPAGLARAFYSKFRTESSEFHSVATFLSDEVNTLMVTAVLPLFVSAYERHESRTGHPWEADPMAAPLLLREAFSLWRQLLRGGDGMKLYFKLTWDMVGSRLSTYITRRWAAHDPGSLLPLIREWEPLLSPAAAEYLLQYCVGPKILSRLHQASESVAFAAPWAEVPGGFDMLQTSGVLTQLHTRLALSLASAPLPKVFEELTPLAGILPQKTYGALVEKHASRRGEDFLKNFTFDPEAEVGAGVGGGAPPRSLAVAAEALRGVEMWCRHDASIQRRLSRAISRWFFPKFLYSVACFARGGACRVAPATAYYRAWREHVFPQSFLKSSALGAECRRGLFPIAALLVEAKKWWAMQPQKEGPAPSPEEFDVVCVAREANALLKVEEAAGRGVALGGPASSGAAAPTPVMSVTRDRIIAAEGKTLKELVEEYAAEEDINFAPRPRIYHEGKQVYALGPLRVCFEASLMLVSRAAGWEPAGSIQQVLHEASLQESEPKRQRRSEESPPPPDPADAGAMDID